MRRLRIEHRTGYRYDAVANASYNEARMLPAADPGQIVLASRLDIRADRRDGAATRRGVTSRHEYLDYYGTRVTSFEVLAPHDALSLVASSLVEVRPTPDVGEDACTWERLAAVGQSTVALSEQLLPTERTAPPVEVARMAEEIAASAATPAQAAHEILHRVGDAMEYVQGVTGVATTAAQAWAKRKGVCQDITHIALGALRRAASRPDTSPGTCSRRPTPRSARLSRASHTRGWSGSTVSGTGTTRRTASRSATGTCAWAAVVTMGMSLRSAACSRARAPHTCSSRWGSPGRRSGRRRPAAGRSDGLLSAGGGQRRCRSAPLPGQSRVRTPEACQSRGRCSGSSCTWRTSSRATV